MVNPKPLNTNGFLRSELRVRDSLLRNPLLLQGLFPVGHLDTADDTVDTADFLFGQPASARLPGRRGENARRIGPA